MNKISEITEGTSKLSFDYGINQERREMKTFDLSFNPPKLKKKKFYSGDYEKEVKSNGDSIEWNYIYGGDGLTAIYRVVNGTGTLYNVAKDHLGSIMALYDNNGNTVEEYSYDAWGRRRDPGTWNLLPRGSDSTYLVSRGYTQHEHLGAFDLINMNGRLYDPIVGRMLSPDILVQDPTSSQGFNRYSYVLNNSLKYVDPSGYAWQYFRYVFGDGVRNLRSFGIWIKRSHLRIRGCPIHPMLRQTLLSTS